MSGRAWREYNVQQLKLNNYAKEDCVFYREKEIRY